MRRRESEHKAAGELSLQGSDHDGSTATAVQAAAPNTSFYSFLPPKIRDTAMCINPDLPYY